MRRIAFAERRFVAKHPELDPWFFSMFSFAARQPRASGARPPPDPPRLALDSRDRRRAWESADLYYRQELAPDFLSAWAEAEEEDPPISGGSPPGGPK